MLKKLFCIEKKYRKFAILNTFMDWMNIIIFIQIANIILLTINNQKVSKLFYIMLIFTFIFQLSYYTIWGKNYINIWSNKSKLYLKKMYFKSVLQDYNHYNVVDIIQGDMINLERLDNIYEIIFPAFFRIIFGLIFILLFSILFKSINFLVYILYFFVMGGSIMLFMKSINTVNRVHMNTFLNIGKRFLNDLNGINTLIMYGQDKVFFDDFKKDSENFRQKTMDLLYAQLQTLFILNFYVFLFSILGVIYNIIQIKLGNISNTQGIILSMILINLLLFTREIGFYMHVVKSAIKPITIAYSKIKFKNDDKINFNEKINTIKIENVDFSYDSQNTLLKNINFEFKTGNVYKIVGENGKGKSTITKLISGVISPDSGKILLNNKDINELNYYEKLKKIGTLGTLSYLFNTTIRENLQINDEIDIYESMKKYDLLDFVNNLELKLDTLVGENGKMLSPGQKQQISLLRLIMSRKDIYIFDEITSSIDKNNSEKINKAVNKLKKESIVIIITHNLKEIDDDENIIFIDNNTIQCNKHKELLKNNKNYFNLYNAKIGENND